VIIVFLFVQRGNPQTWRLKVKDRKYKPIETRILEIEYTGLHIDTPFLNSRSSMGRAAIFQRLCRLLYF